MLFRNLHLYRFTKPFSMSADQLQETLAKSASRPCGRIEMFSLGWAEPLGLMGQLLVHETDSRLMICMRREDKVLPASMVRECVAEKAVALEGERGRPVGYKERLTIKDEIIHDLLPQAFVRSSHTYAYIDPARGWLTVDAASSRRSEELIAMLRKSIGTLDVVLPSLNYSPAAVMTQWLSEDKSTPSGFAIEDECELVGSGEFNSVVKCKNQDMGADEVAAHLRAGKQVKRLALEWDERISFILTDDFVIRRLRFGDAIKAELNDVAEDEASRFDADFALMGAELDGLISSLIQALGGEDESRYPKP